MDAYELAEKIHKAVNADEKHLTLDIEAMIMLRQQADRIAELEKELETLKIWTGTIQPIKTKQCKDCGEINPAEIHTCSPQTKPLSDEEIIKLFWDASWGTDEDVIKFARAIEERHGIK